MVVLQPMTITKPHRVFTLGRIKGLAPKFADVEEIFFSLSYCVSVASPPTSLPSTGGKGDKETMKRGSTSSTCAQPLLLTPRCRRLTCGVQGEMLVLPHTQCPRHRTKKKRKGP